MRAVHDQQNVQHMIDDHQFYQQPSDVGPYDLVWDRPLSPEPEPIQQEDFNFLDRPETFDPYDKMAPGTIKITEVYDRTLPMNSLHNNLTFRILRDTFFKDGFTGDIDGILSEVERLSNFQIMKVKTVQNKALYEMHRAFEKAYRIQNTQMTYHGSNKAASISVEGFRGAVCERALWGKGIYSSSNVWEAVAYADGDVVSVLLVSTHVGLHQVGKRNQEDFGRHPSGRPYNTLTNINGNIFCCKNEAQLLPTVEITLRYMHENKHTDEHVRYVGIYNHALAQRIQANNAPVQPADADADDDDDAAADAGPALEWADQAHTYWRIGEDVTITRGYKAKYNDYIGFRGVIRKIMARGSEYLIFVHLTHDTENKPVHIATEFDLVQKNGSAFRFLKDRDRAVMKCLPCRQSHMAYYNTPISASMGAAGKRPADTASDDKDSASDDQAGAKKARSAGPGEGSSGGAAAP